MIASGLLLFWLLHRAAAGDATLSLCGYKSSLPWGSIAEAETCPLLEAQEAEYQSAQPASQASHAAANDKSGPPSIPPSWRRSSTCYQRYRGEWCAFTDPA